MSPSFLFLSAFNLIKLGCVLQQPLLLDLGHIPDISLLTSLHDLVKDDPVGLSVLDIQLVLHFVER